MFSWLKSCLNLIVFIIFLYKNCHLFSFSFFKSMLLNTCNLTSFKFGSDFKQKLCKHFSSLFRCLSCNSSMSHITTMSHSSSETSFIYIVSPLLRNSLFLALNCSLFLYLRTEINHRLYSSIINL